MLKRNWKHNLKNLICKKDPRKSKLMETGMLPFQDALCKRQSWKFNKYDCFILFPIKCITSSNGHVVGFLSIRLCNIQGAAAMVFAWVLRIKRSSSGILDLLGKCRRVSKVGAIVAPGEWSLGLYRWYLEKPDNGTMTIIGEPDYTKTFWNIVVFRMFYGLGMWHLYSRT